MTMRKQVYAVGGLKPNLEQHALLMERYDPQSGKWASMAAVAPAVPGRAFHAVAAWESMDV